MGCRGVFFAITAEQAGALLAAPSDGELVARLEEIEEAWDTENLAECDEAWDAMHRCLTDGRLESGNGPYPFNHAVLGPRQLHGGDGYVVSLVSPEQVRDVAKALQAVTQEWFEHQYRTVVPKAHALEYGDEELEYTWDRFQGVRELYARAAEEGRAVIFTADR